MNKVLFTILIVILLLGVGGGTYYWYTTQKPAAPAEEAVTFDQQLPEEQALEETPMEASIATQASPTGQTVPAETTIMITDKGFVPPAVTVKAGATVVWKNDSGVMANVSSAVHPTHLVYPKLNLGDVEDGGNVSLIFSDAGTYQFHNHLIPSQTGSVTVTK